MQKPLDFPMILIDSREQTPWSFTLPSVRACVPRGADYSLAGFETAIGIERKSLGDMIGSLTAGRERFMRSLAALRERPWRCLIVESTLGIIRSHSYRSRVHPNSIVGSLASIVADGVPVFLAGDHNQAAAFAEKLLQKFHSRAVAARRVAA